MASSVIANESDSYSNDCGPNSLALLLRTSGCDVALEEVNRALPEHHDTGFSLADLQSAALKFGVRLSGVRLEKRDLPLSRAAIAFLSNSVEGHFIVLRPVGTTGKMVQVLDPPSAPAVVDYDQLLASPDWTGRVLVQETLAERFLSWSWVAISGILLFGGVVFTRRRVLSWGRRGVQFYRLPRRHPLGRIEKGVAHPNDEQRLLWK